MRSYRLVTSRSGHLYFLHNKFYSSLFSAIFLQLQLNLICVEIHSDFAKDILYVRPSNKIQSIEL